MLHQNLDYVVCEKAAFMSPKAPTSITQGVCVGTKNHLFFIPAQTMGFYPMLQTFRTHYIFQELSVSEGVRAMISNCKSVKELEQAFIELLESNVKYVHHIPSFERFLISGIFIKNNLRLIHSRFNYYACILKPKAAAKEFREFYGM